VRRIRPRLTYANVMDVASTKAASFSGGLIIYDSRAAAGSEQDCQLYG
jgi:hypothetical protein